MKEKLILIDGNSLFNRAFFALPPLMNKDGMYTNAIYGFAMMLTHILERYQPQYMAVAFDLKAPTFRHQEYEDYKAGRARMPEELRMQIEPLKQMVDAMGIARAEFTGYEADDIIGTLSKFGEVQKLSVYIVTGDKDALQLASDETTVLITKKGITETEPYDRAAVIARYGLTPTEFIDLKALMGDKSDNIKGVAGIGEKTGIKLLQEFGSIEGIYENLESIKGAVRTKLEADEASAFLSKRLATIVRDMPMELSLDELAYKGASPQLEELYRSFGFTALLAKLRKQGIASNDEAESDAQSDPFRASTEIEEPSSTEAARAQAHVLREIVSIAGADLGVQNREILLSAALEKLSASGQYRIHRAYLQWDEVLYCTQETELHTLKSLLENPGNRIIGHDLKTLYKAFLCYDIELATLDFDLELAAYVEDPNVGHYSMADLSDRYGVPAFQSIEDVLGKGKTRIALALVDPGQLDRCYQNVMAAIEAIHPQLRRAIEAVQSEEVLYRIEMPLIKVLAGMERIGFVIDQALLHRLSVQFAAELQALEHEIHEMAGEVFNINSPKQLGIVLFERLQLPTGKKTKTGYSTNAEVLEYLKPYHPIIEKVLEYRQIGKLKSTYIDGLSAIVDHDTGRVYTTFSQTTAATGRLSSLDPNLQNIPIRTERGRQLRGLFVAPEGYRLVDADYSQIELRILAHLADDRDMQAAFADNVDIHTKTASEVFGAEISDVTSEMRSAAKAVNFGIVYGISDFGLSNNLGISIPQAKQYINQYLDRYQAVQAYLTDIVHEVERTGYSTTIFGRRRAIPELKAKNQMVRGFGKRLAMNTPIQGAAADIIKLAMIAVDRHLKEHYPKAQLLLQVHDELIVAAPAAQAEQIKQEMIEIMEHAVQLRVRLLVEAKVGESWLDTK